LTEAANETAKTGALTGSLADALNWAGVNEEKFQEQLDGCNTEQERQALITETLNGLYSETADKYRETNKEVIAANEANEAWTASMAEVGAAAEPLLTEVKSMGAALLSDLVPAIQFMLDNLPAIGVALAGITAAVVAFKIAAIAATAASKGMTLAQYAMAAAQKVLNVVMSANPIGLIILAITGLVTAFMLLWKNCEGFRNFFRNAPTVAFIACPVESYSGEYDCGLLSENMMLSAWSMGIGSCCLGSVVPVMNSEEAKPYMERLQLPEDYKLLVAIAFGYPAGENPVAPERDATKAYYVE
jgi:nitroreductase